MSAALAVQKALRSRLVATPSILERVPAVNILDRNARPNPMPSIIIGEGEEVDEGDIARRNVRVHLTLHLWQKETGTTGVKGTAGAIRSAVLKERLIADGFHVADCRVSMTRFLRDPDGEHAHGVVTVETLVHEVGA
ncbi:DUF3168 domain-containing protein [Antarcticirhabdus aurantiaca]|uniref:DUF3168 domain-containing protein n=1 Tax=Antarcticirhabdus aurantiaca TaxID=2606717 RepID=A0ACD4NW42_9HYPH|nr:DUF3168 domain-containing protein [Jeongeuplla avenae]